MAEATEATQAATAPRKKANSLSTMLLADLKALAGGLGIAGTATMKKAQLVEAIKGYQDAHSQAPRAGKPESQTSGATEPVAAAPQETADAAAPKVTRRTRGGSARATAAPDAGSVAEETAATTAESTASAAQDEPRGETQGGQRQRQRRDGRDRANAPETDAAAGDEKADDVAEGAGENQNPQGEERRGRNRNRNRDRQNNDGDTEKSNADGQNTQSKQSQQGKQDQQSKEQRRQNDKQDGGKQDGAKQGQKQGGNQARENQARENQAREDKNRDGDYDDYDDEDGEGGGRRNRRRRGRERNTGRQSGRNEPDTTILEDDVLVPAAGILDVLDNYAFVRTSGYLPGPDDVYLSLSMVRKYGLRRGDAVVGQVRQPREGERREKFNPMVRIDQVNGLDPEAGKERPEFDNFVPVHPNTRLRLETGRDNLLGRIVDVVAPIGKGQRGMVLSPPRSGKTQVLQTLAASISHNNPECHVMVVLIDERPEEVTDYQRTVRGEVVASTFDRPAADHVLLAELAVERAKRLVEMGHDVVVLLDSLTRLARAFNVAAPGSGRQGTGGVDAVALHPAKRLFGAARNVEDGGSLTILATALVESGSPLDEAVLDEFNDTANMELRLRRELVERRIFPPVDVVDSGTRREEHLLSQEEQAITFKLRSALMDLGPREALGRVLERMTTSGNNEEFLAQVQRATEAELTGA